MIECARAAIKKDFHLEEFYLKLRCKRGKRKAPNSCCEKIGLVCVLDAEAESH
jgi:hypothetical protein